MQLYRYMEYFTEITGLQNRILKQSLIMKTFISTVLKQNKWSLKQRSLEREITLKYQIIGSC